MKLGTAAVHDEVTANPQNKNDHAQYRRSDFQKPYGNGVRAKSHSVVPVSMARVDFDGSTLHSNAQRVVATFDDRIMSRDVSSFLPSSRLTATFRAFALGRQCDRAQFLN